MGPRALPLTSVMKRSRVQTAGHVTITWVVIGVTVRRASWASAARSTWMNARPHPAVTAPPVRTGTQASCANVPPAILVNIIM